VPRWYDAVASPCHLFSRGHNHVAETSRADHCRAPCDHRRIAPLVPTSVGWDDRCVPLSYKKGKPFRGVAIAKSRLLSSSTVSPLLVSPSASFGQPATSPSPLLLRPRRASYLAVFVDNLQKKLEEDREKNPSPIVDHGSIHGDVRVLPLDACSDVPLHCRRSLLSHPEISNFKM
jgi:hypothetical protein